MPLLSKNSIIKLNETVRTVQNTPVGNQSRHYRRKPAASDYPHMAINRTEDELKIGYIVEVVAFDGDKNLFTIQQPSADDLPNVAVVLTPAVVGHMVALSFTGPHMLWTPLDTGQDTPSAWGSTKDSYEAKEGTTFTHISHTSFLSDTDRVSATFAGGGVPGDGYNGYFKLIKVVDENGGVTFSVKDGADLDATMAGYALINTQSFFVPTELELTEKYVWMEAMAYETETDVWEIGPPTIEESDEMPSYEEYKLKIIIGRIIDDECYQEHHGAMYGDIAAECTHERS